MVSLAQLEVEGRKTVKQILPINVKIEEACEINKKKNPKTITEGSGGRSQDELEKHTQPCAVYCEPDYSTDRINSSFS